MSRGKRVLRTDVDQRSLTRRQRSGLDLYFWLQTFTAILVAFILSFLFLGKITNVDGSSMVPTLREGDKLLLQSVGYAPRQGDIVVLTKYFDAAQGPIVKRVIATGGQHLRIDYEQGVVYVDDQPLSEPYLAEPMREPGYPHQSELLVPEGTIFVMGDNRNGSADSRDLTLGVVDERYILGRVRAILYPFSAFTVFP